MNVARVGRAVEASTEVEPSSLRTFWASSARTPPARSAAEKAVATVLNFIAKAYFESSWPQAADSKGKERG